MSSVEKQSHCMERGKTSFLGDLNVAKCSHDPDPLVRVYNRLPLGGGSGDPMNLLFDTTLTVVN